MSEKGNLDNYFAWFLKKEGQRWPFLIEIFPVHSSNLTKKGFDQIKTASNSDDSTQWIDSGDIPIDFGPRFRLAFRYTGSGKTASDGTYEIDDIRVFNKQ